MKSIGKWSRAKSGTWGLTGCGVPQQVEMSWVIFAGRCRSIQKVSWVSSLQTLTVINSSRIFRLVLSMNQTLTITTSMKTISTAKLQPKNWKNGSTQTMKIQPTHCRTFRRKEAINGFMGDRKRHRGHLVTTSLVSIQKISSTRLPRRLLTNVDFGTGRQSLDPNFTMTVMIVISLKASPSKMTPVN